MDPLPTLVPFLLVLSNPSLATKGKVDNRLLQGRAVAKNSNEKIRQGSLTAIGKYLQNLKAPAI
jgi:hypothetical protein